MRQKFRTSRRAVPQSGSRLSRGARNRAAAARRRAGRRSTARRPRRGRRRASRSAATRGRRGRAQSMPRRGHGQQAAHQPAWRSTTCEREAAPARRRAGTSRRGAGRRSSQTALTSAPRPTESASPAWPNSGTKTRFIACVSDEHDDGDRHRRAHVLARIEAGGEDLDADQAEQADAVAAQRERRLVDRQGVELAALEQRRDQRPPGRPAGPPRTAGRASAPGAGPSRACRSSRRRRRGRCAAESCGISTAPRATPSSAVGNSISRSA